jgi:hypothetical protein
MTDLRRLPAYMAFWDAINEGRAEQGLPEALYANVRALWEQALVPTATEVEVAALRITRLSNIVLAAGGVEA